MAGRLLVLVAALSVAMASTAAAATNDTGPDASTMTLQASDFPGSHAKGGWVSPKTSIIPVYERDITFAKPYGASHYFDVVSFAFLAPDSSEAAQLYAILGHKFSSKAYRRAFVRQYLPVKAAKISMITPRALHVPDSSMEIGFLVRVGTRTLDLSVSFVRLDRVLGMAVAAGTASTIAASDATAFATLAAGHIAAGLQPISISLPTISGTAAVGQTLTASTGGWDDQPVTYAYQWQRCDSTGAACADVPGASAATYPVTAADAGATLRVEVTATNRFGSLTEPSAVTAVVPQPG